MIENIRGLADHYGCKPSQIGKLIYRATECGCTFNESEDSVSISGYAEGSDWEGELHTFTYPFDVKAFEAQLELCDEEGVEQWHEANDDNGEW